MKKYSSACYAIMCLGVSILIQGCATTPRPAAPVETPNIEPPKVRFSEFKNVELKSVQLVPRFAAHSANQKARNKVDEELATRLRAVFPEMTKVDSSSTPTPGVRTLVIEPVITDIKFIGGAVRFWAGAMAGSSHIKMTVTYRDSSTGEAIAEPHFYAHANAMAGAWSIGQADNAMLRRIAQDAVTYSSFGR